MGNHNGMWRLTQFSWRPVTLRRPLRSWLCHLPVAYGIGSTCKAVHRIVCCVQCSLPCVGAMG